MLLGGRAAFWELDGVYTTAVGYAGGFTANPTYEEACSGRTGHAEAVLVVFDPEKISYQSLLTTFFESHDPTQGMRQGNDHGSQYRSAIYYTNDEQKRAAEATRDAYDAALKRAGRKPVTTELAPAGPFYYAEEYHQQYLHKVPWGYCGLEGTGVACPMPARKEQAMENGHNGLKPLPTTDEEWKSRLSPSSTTCCAGPEPSGPSPAPSSTPRMTDSTAAPPAVTRSSTAARSTTPAAAGPASPRRSRRTPSNC